MDVLDKLRTFEVSFEFFFTVLTFQFLTLYFHNILPNKYFPIQLNGNFVNLNANMLAAIQGQSSSLIRKVNMLDILPVDMMR